jgi:cytochrome c peroxidase
LSLHYNGITTGGPKVSWRPGRIDYDRPEQGVVKENLPDGSQGAKHIRDVFYRMGFNDKEIVVLSGGHAVGRCHHDRSGYDGPWVCSVDMI